MPSGRNRIDSKLRLPKEAPLLKGGVTESTQEVTVTRASLREYAAKQRERYEGATRAEGCGLRGGRGKPGIRAVRSPF
jgi:hypothetical protein